MSKELKQIILDNQVQKIADLNDEGKLLFEFLTLIVDIRYRHKYGNAIASQQATGYSGNTQYNALAGQVSPVDDGLPGH